jgi:hypothetical protein
MKPTILAAITKPSQRSRPIALSIVLMVATMIGGLTIRFVHLGLLPIIVKYGGSMLWALMIYWIVSALLPSLRLLAAALISAALATAVECFKLHHSPALDAFRLTIPGILLLGRVFSTWDILAYWLAIPIGIFMDLQVRPGHRADGRAIWSLVRAAVPAPAYDKHRTCPAKGPSSLPLIASLGPTGRKESMEEIANGPARPSRIEKCQNGAL